MASPLLPRRVIRSAPTSPSQSGQRNMPIEFDDSCVIVHMDPLSTTEDGIRKKLSTSTLSAQTQAREHEITKYKYAQSDNKAEASRSESGTTAGPDPIADLTSSTHPSRGRLSGLINLPALQSSPPATKLRALARKLSSSFTTPPIQTISKSSPAPPLTTPPANPSRKSSTMPVVPPISTSTLPSVVYASSPVKLATGLNQLAADGLDQDGQVILVNENNVLGSSVASSNLTALDEDVVYSPSLPVTPQGDSYLSLNNCVSRRAPLVSRNSSFADDLAALSEEDENDDRLHKRTSASAPPTPVSPSQSCSGIWLCSRPPTSRLPQCQDVLPAPPPTRKTRPFIVRSMSTGRLASEFDEEGRVICLSVHSDRVLRPSVSPSPRTRKISGGPSASTPALLRTQSYQASKRSPTSPSDPALNKLGLPARPVRTQSELIRMKQSSQERLVAGVSPLVRTTSVGASWKKKAWQMGGRSVRV